MVICPPAEEVIKNIDINALYKYLNIQNISMIPIDIIKQIDTAINLLGEQINPYIVFKEFDKFITSNKSITLDNKFILRSFVLSKIAPNAKSVIVFIATNGDLIEKKALSYFSEGSYFMSQVTDAYGSVLVEATVNVFLKKFETNISKDGYLLSAVFSPGYCDIDLPQQKEIFRIIGAENTNITINEYGQMYPEKSISGICFKMKADIAKNYKKYFLFCDKCDNKLCKYNKR